MTRTRTPWTPCSFSPPAALSAQQGRQGPLLPFSQASRGALPGVPRAPSSTIPRTGSTSSRCEALCADVHVESLVAAGEARTRAPRACSRGEALTLPYFRSRPPASVGAGRPSARERHHARVRVFVADGAIRGRRASACAASSISSTWIRRSGASTRGRGHGRFRRSTSARHAACSPSSGTIASACRGESSSSPTRRRSSSATRRPNAPAASSAIRNGVDSEYFSPAHDFASPFAPGERAIVFTGAMDYWPNVDAVSWFAREVLPEIRRRDPAARFYVVGMNPDAAVRALASDPAIGRDGARRRRSPLSAARAGGRGAAAGGARDPEQGPRGDGDGEAVVVTPPTAAALSARPGVELEVAADAAEFAAKVLLLMDPERATRWAPSRARASSPTTRGQRAMRCSTICSSGMRQSAPRGPPVRVRCASERSPCTLACQGERTMNAETERVLRAPEANLPCPAETDGAGWRIALPLVLLVCRRHSRHLLAHRASRSSESGRARKRSRTAS